MKKVYKYALAFFLSFCSCFLFIMTAHATDTNEQDKVYYNGSVFEIGDTITYECSNLYNTGNVLTSYFKETLVTDSMDLYMCFYLSTDSNTNSGFKLVPYGVPSFVTLWLMPDSSTFLNDAVGYGSQEVPFEYSSTIVSKKVVSTSYFYTNLPIFETYELAEQYHNGEDVAAQALNYNKEYANGSWVRPFEDIEINDSDILVPDLSNISHTGFTVTNCSDERYLVDIYMESGLESIETAIAGTLEIDDAMYVNNYGLITDYSEAYYNGPDFDIAQLFGIDNYAALVENYTDFYTKYPNAVSYDSNVSLSDLDYYYQIWGEPFGKKFVFYNGRTSVDSSDLSLVTPYDIPLCYTQYKVRYFYYDDSSGFHYGPWGVYTYFSTGDVVKSSIFQSNTGDIITTPAVSGSQDSDGNIGYIDDTNYIDLNNTNELFGNIRAIFNNLQATFGSYSVIFATVFSFIPVDIQGIIWLGIVLMVFIGIAKAVVG